MKPMVFMQVRVDTCPDCGIKVRVEGELPAGRMLVCPSCGTNLGFVEATSGELDWAFESDEFKELGIVSKLRNRTFTI